MAVATSTIIAGSALALGATQAIAGMSEKSKAKKAIGNYKRQKLVNPYENMQISTRGSDLIREEGVRTINNLSHAIVRGGSRTITSNMGRVAATSNDASARSAMVIDQQVNNRNQMIAQANGRIQQMYEQRERDDLAGLGAQMQAGNETMWNGLSSMQQAVGYGVNNGMFSKSSGTRPYESRTEDGQTTTTYKD